MGICFIGIIYGSVIFWVLISSAIAAAGVFIAFAIRRIISDKKQCGVLAEYDKPVVYTAVQLQEISKMIADTGYAFDPQQNIFFSMLDPWQRKLGYCSLYDDASVPLGMVFDCEPIRFQYGGKSWLIELWKGQYGITTGAEIGIYTTTGPNLNIPGIYDGTFYQCAEDIDHLSMTYTLLQNNQVLFTRAARHWWLTGFKLGDYADPSELTMEASITFVDTAMRDAVLKDLYRTGYSENEVRYGGNTVLILFKKPHSRQPLLRTGLVCRTMQSQLKSNVEIFRELAGGANNVYDIFMAAKNSPEQLGMILTMGRHKELFNFYEAIRPYFG